MNSPARWSGVSGGYPRLTRHGEETASIQSVMPRHDSGRHSRRGIGRLTVRDLFIAGCLLREETTTRVT
jgi:hypothetical protein